MARKGLTSAQYLYELLESGGGGGGGGNSHDPAIGDENATGDAKTDPSVAGTVLEFLKGGVSISGQIKEILSDQIVNKLTELIGKNGTATWVVQETASSATPKPSTGADGVEVGGAPNTFVGVFLDTATTADFTIWCLVDGEWGVPRHGVFTEQTNSYLEMSNSVGVERIYVQLNSSDGDVILKAAPVSYQ